MNFVGLYGYLLVGTPNFPGILLGNNHSELLIYFNLLNTNYKNYSITTPYLSLLLIFETGWIQALPHIYWVMGLNHLLHFLLVDHLPAANHPPQGSFEKS